VQRRNQYQQVVRDEVVGCVDVLFGPPALAVQAAYPRLYQEDVLGVIEEMEQGQVEV
jgi:hypothetical protein